MSQQMNAQQAGAAPLAGAPLGGNTTVKPAQTVVHAPIVQETVRNDRITEVQPVLHREVDKNIVHHVEKHINEARAPNMGGVVEKNAIVEQQVHTNVVNEIQPVIHRERVVPVTERVEQHLSQRVVEPTIHTHEVIYDNTPLQPGMTAPLGTQQQTNLQGAEHEKKHGLFHKH